MKKEQLEKKTKIQLWIIMCELGIINGDCSLYRMRSWTKQEMLEAIENMR